MVRSRFQSSVAFQPWEGNEWQIGLTLVTQLFLAALAGTGVSAAQSGACRRRPINLLK